MAGIAEKVANPSYYKGKLSGFAESATAYYRPLFRSGSIKPLWHVMFATSVIMYTTNYICLKGEKAQHARKEKEVALQEYYKNHGISHHH